MINVIRYFIENKRLNYALLLFLLYMGINAYINIPKELFPITELDKISVRGSYSGASADNMDKMAVRELEDAVSNISGIIKNETTIAPGYFSMFLTLDENANKVSVLNNVKDAIALAKQYLPADMHEPTAVILDRNRPLIRLAISSDKLSLSELTELSKEVKNQISRIKNISEVAIRGEADQQLTLKINSDALLAYGLTPKSVINAIKNLSYIFPIGDIEQKGNFAFISTLNGHSDTQGWEETIIGVDSKYVRLGDIAEVLLEYPQTNTLSTFNHNTTLNLVISKNEEGNSLELSKEMRRYVEKLALEHDGVYFDLYQDSSKPIKDRLSTVISNLMFGLLLVFAALFILINLRIAFIVVLGIPFSFIIGLLFIYYAGYSINIMSLLGALIVIGIVVDDAIVVSENIQRHIDEGMEIKEASILGTKEMLLPVTLATLTTAAAFLPMFLMKGEISLFLILVPIVVVMILLGSLIESFFFLPLHAQEFLKKSHNFVDWTPLQNLYERILRFHIRYKKSFLLTVFVLIPIFTVILVSSMRFQFFPNFDGNNLYISGKLDINTPIEETFAIAKEIEAQMIEHGEEFSLKSSSSTSGYRRSLSGETEFNNNVFYITLELYDRVDTNFVNKYLNPILNFSFDFNSDEKRRELRTFELSPRAHELIEPFREKYNLLELGVMEDKPGLIRSDIQINLSGKEDTQLEQSIEMLKEKLSSIEGVANSSDNIKYGKLEYKIKVNSFGESLGLNETSVASLLSDYFLEKRQGVAFNENGIMEIKTQERVKDNTQTLMDFPISLGDGRIVTLRDIAEITAIRDYEKIDKLNAERVKTVFANLDKRVITAEEVLSILEPTLDEIAAKGVSVNLLGEKEKNRELQGDMKNSLALALFLIFLTLLLIFSKIKYVLMLMSVIPLSVIGALLGHKLLGIPLTMPSIIGILGLAGVVVNDGIIMLDFLKGTHNAEHFFTRAKQRLRPILITTITTFLGLFTLIFYATGQAVILQPIAISIGFGLLWGTVLNLIYLPTLYALVNKIEPTSVLGTKLPKAEI